MTYIIYPPNTNSTTQLGGKAGALALLHNTDLPIPAWVALSPTAFYDSLNDTQRNALGTVGNSAGILALLRDLKPTPAVQAELKQALSALCPNGELVAVRSSALDEDGVQHSFAGQLDSFLNMPPDEVVDKVVAVWCSAFSERILAYRRERGLALVPQAPAVLIQRMVKADVSGVAFSADPVTGRRNVAVVGAVNGLGMALVSGEVDADTYYVNGQGQIIERQLAVKQSKNGRMTNGEWREKWNGKSPALNDSQVQGVADLVRRTEQIFGHPQDIEWAIEGEQLFLLQSRPITTLAHLLDPEGVLNLWDNSNIAESYPGVTTPLTFSFARRAYEEVYRQFCHLMGVPKGTITDNATTFRRMLGLMQGRIYYNLLSWYRVLAMLPGYKVNRRFMEQMMGVKESLPDELLDKQSPPTQGARLQDGLRLGRTLVGLVVNFLCLPRRIEAFYRRLNRALGTGRPDLSKFRPDELVSYYRDLEQQLLTRWDAPLVNDFFAMIFYGLLRKLTEKWCGDTHGTLQNNLLMETGGIVSAEPVTRIRQMAQLATTDLAFVTILNEGSLSEILECMSCLPKFEAAYHAYLDKFSDRCLEELKIESPTLHDNPLMLLRSVGQLARSTPNTSPAEGEDETGVDTSSTKTKLSAQAAERIYEALAHHPIRRIVFYWVLKKARILLRNRENLRFERTRLFGRARMIFIELGRRFYALDLLADPRDIFYLEVEETLGLVDGTSTTADSKGLVALRQAEFERYQAMEALPTRFETRGIPYQSINHQGTNQIQNPKSKIQNRKSLRGLGCSPGIVRGRVRIVTDPKNTAFQSGEILVAERTDPGWILLFPMAAGLLVEHGSLLSHSAIVSREMGLPAIVSLSGITDWLKDGDRVEFDGSTGVVTKIE